MKFKQKLLKIQNKNKSLLSVGLDPDFAKIPVRFKKQKYPQFAFNRWVIEETHQFVCTYKPNSAFYEARGIEGIKELKLTCDYLHSEHPNIPILLDFKRGDIGNTNAGYTQFAFEYLQVDAATIQPYLGQEAMQPFLDYKEKGIFVLCKTSNEGSGEFQDKKIGSQKLWEYVAQQVADQWNKNKNCGLVVGATYPEELQTVRNIVGDMPILVPGVGAQGGDLANVLKHGLTENKRGLLINSSRGIIFTDKPGEAAEKVWEQINTFL